MNKKLFAILLTCVVLSFLVGCTSESIQVNVSNSEKLYSDNFKYNPETNTFEEIDSK